MSSTAPFERRDAAAGFTLIEVLVALAVVAVCIASIGSLVAVNVRSTRALDRHLPLVSIARAIETGLPDRAQEDGGRLSGEIAGRRWQVDYLPFSGANMDARRATPWIPQTVVITVTDPAGAKFQLDTIRLRRRPER